MTVLLRHLCVTGESFQLLALRTWLSPRFTSGFYVGISVNKEENIVIKPEGQRIKVLLVEDDKDDYVLFQDLLSEIPKWKFDLDWAPSYGAALQKSRDCSYDVCFLDYQLGEINGLELLRELLDDGLNAPAIMLTGQGGYGIDLQAMKEGAADYLEKSGLDSETLERSIRYSLNRSATLDALRRSENQLRHLSSKLLETQENERKFVARELHDSIGASLSAIKVSLERKLNAMKKGRASSDDILLEDIIGIVQGTIKETKRIQKNLRPPVLDDLGIVVALRSLCREFEGLVPDMKIEHSLDVSEQDVPESLKIVVYRISQEALNNIAKHSRATSVSLTLTKRRDHLKLCIKDNGQGFDLRDALEKPGEMRGMGLSSMKERSEHSGGTFSLFSSKGKGTRVQAFWPL
jgi:signal transduction histidine kinase